jgi:hypothetical protein
MGNLFCSSQSPSCPTHFVRVAAAVTINYGWAGDVMLSDQIDDIVASYSREMSQDHEEARRQAKTLFDEMTEWKPKFERAIEPAAAEVYLALRKGPRNAHRIADSRWQ